jgi:hypothetical protein
MSSTKLIIHIDSEGIDESEALAAVTAVVKQGRVSKGAHRFHYAQAAAVGKDIMVHCVPQTRRNTNEVFRVRRHAKLPG